MGGGGIPYSPRLRSASAFGRDDQASLLGFERPFLWDGNWIKCFALCYYKSILKNLLYTRSLSRLLAYMDLNAFEPPYKDQLVRVSEGIWACVPRHLPPAPNWQTTKVIGALSKAERAVGRLDYAGRHVQTPHLLIRPLMLAGS